MRLWTALFVSACASGKLEGTEPSTPLDDARLIADITTWTCEDSDGAYPGIFGQELRLIYAPEALPPLGLPSPGSCSANMDLFPRDPGPGAASLGLAPRWSGAGGGGTLAELEPGYYYDKVLDNVHSCLSLPEHGDEPVTLTEAGELEGVTTPAFLDIPDVEFVGISGDGTGVDYGQRLTASWGEHGWEEVWVHFQRLVGDDVVEAVTCNATGLSLFLIDADIWGLMDEGLDVERNNLYIGFQRSDEVATDSGLEVEVLSRAMAIAIVEESN
jgi:hypothetical protein